MSFNTQTQPKHASHVEGTTHQGGTSFKQSKKEELFLLVSSSLMSGDNFYETMNDKVVRFRNVVADVLDEKDGANFCSQLAKYARYELYMRTTPTILSTELFLGGKNKVKVDNNLATDTAMSVWLRGDEPMEALAYTKVIGSKRPSSLLKALAKRFNKLTEYQAIKYAKKTKAFSLRDAIRLAHPKPVSEKQAALLKACTHEWAELSDTERALLPMFHSLKDEDQSQTWEQLISKKGSTKEAWEEAVSLMGYMAKLRNLRNFVENNVSNLDAVLAIISDKEEIAKSKQFPYRFFSAYRELKKINAPRMVLDALSNAMDASSVNVTPLTGNMLVMVDLSGSMYNRISTKSTVEMVEVACGLAAILAKNSKADVHLFSTENMPYVAPTSTPAVLMAEQMLSSRIANSGTDTGRALQSALSVVGKVYDRIIVITDEQTSDNAMIPIHKYLGKNYNTRVYVINLSAQYPAAFDTTYNQICRVGGYSDKVFDWMRLTEMADPIKQIMSYVVPEKKNKVILEDTVNVD